MSNSIMLEKSKDFAVDIVLTSRLLREKRVESHMINQLLRCGTSIGANLHESKYAHSTADFISKMQISLKEAHETLFWLEILKRTDSIELEDYHKLNSSCSAISRMLISAINTTKKNNGIE